MVKRLLGRVGRCRRAVEVVKKNIVNKKRMLPSFWQA